MWRYVILSAHASWLHGDKRGFRDRGHRLHSSGDYKKPPPEGEHESLHRHIQQRSKGKVVFSHALRSRIGTAFVDKLDAMGYRCLCAAVGRTHAHCLVELPKDIATVKKEVGKAKQAASLAVGDVLPGQIWAEGGKFKPVTTRSHLNRSYRYILEEQEPDAWTWSYRQA